MKPQHLSILDFKYELPDEKIAKFPLKERDESKLLCYKNGYINETIFKNLDTQLKNNSFIVFNNTKVVEARILFNNLNGAKIEIFCLEPSENYDDMTTAMLQKKNVLWKCLVGGAKKWKQNERLVLHHEDGLNSFNFFASISTKESDFFIIDFSWTNENLTFAEVLQFVGEIPLPPYLNRKVEVEDKNTYQTTYAKHDGSVAAPTAGLHFTKGVFDSLQIKNIQNDFVTLHVGAGTFKPVKAAIMNGHDMHAEFIEVKQSFIENLLTNLHNDIIVVGTTSLRTVESLYWIGVKLFTKKDISISKQHILSQWDCYELPQDIRVEVALKSLLDWLKLNNQNVLFAKTQIMIAPGYKLKIASAIITNFHQPSSTLILLVASIVGNEWKKIYSYALQNDFRFLSYGDSSLIWK